MKKIAVLLAALLFAAPAAAQNTKAQMTTEINTNFGDNTTGLITPSIARTSFNDMVTSWQQAPKIRAVVATSDTIVLADYGQLVTYNNANPVAVTLPQATTTFATFNLLVKNIGTGLVTITPTVSQINGAATLLLAQNQSAFIISDGTNWQLGPSIFGLTGTNNIGANGGVGGQLTLNGSTSGSATLSLFDATASFFRMNKGLVSDGSYSSGLVGGTNGQITFTGSTSGNSSFLVGNTGNLFLGPGPDGRLTIGPNGATSGALALNGTTSGGAIFAVAGSGGHVTFLSSSTPSLTAGCNGAGSAVSGTDLSGTITGSTAAATTCTLTFGTAFGAAPNCIASGLTSPLTGAITPSTTTLVVNFASTANYKFTYFCPGL